MTEPSLPPLLAELAAVQGGAWTRAQALACGETAHTIRRHLRSAWCSPYPGVYVDRSQLQSVDAAGRHVLLAAARVLGSGLRPVVSHQSAAVCLELPVLGRLPAGPVLTRPPDGAATSSSSANLKIAALPRRDWIRYRGVPVTSGERTVCDLARSVGLDAAVVTLDTALRRGLDDHALHDVVQRCSSWPGGTRIASVLAAADPRAETPIESLTRLRYREFGLPEPVSQAQVFDPDGHEIGRVDFLFWQHGVVGDADGMLKYDREGALREEKRREQSFRRYGLEVLRNNWQEALPGRSPEFRVRALQAFALAAGRPRARGLSYRVPPLAELRALDARRGTLFRGST